MKKRWRSSPRGAASGPLRRKVGVATPLGVMAGHANMDCIRGSALWSYVLPTDSHLDLTGAENPLAAYASRRPRSSATDASQRRFTFQGAL